MRGTRGGRGRGGGDSVFLWHDVALISDDIKHSSESPAAPGWRIDECGICGKPNQLVCCDLCFRAYHLSCLGQSAVEGVWLCPRCKPTAASSGSNTTTPSRQKRKKRSPSPASHKRRRSSVSRE